MIKILILGTLAFFAYRLFIPSSLQAGDNENKELDNEEYTDYEEVD
jgi:hypothetical protein